MSCPNTSTSPTTVTAAIDRRTRPAINTMHQPSIQMTPASGELNEASVNVHDSRMIVTSINTSASPRVKRYRDSGWGPALRP